MLRTRNTLSIMAQTMAGIGVIAFTWAAIGYSLAFTPGSPWVGDLGKLWAAGVIAGGRPPIRSRSPFRRRCFFSTRWALNRWPGSGAARRKRSLTGIAAGMAHSESDIIAPPCG